MVTNKELSEILSNTAISYLIRGENQFKVLAYQKAADTIENLNQELFDIWQSEGKFFLPGVGKSIEKHIIEYFKNKSKNYLISEIQKIPSSVYELIKIPGIGPKKAIFLVKKLKIFDKNSAIDLLEKKANEGLIQKIRGFGPKSEAEILQNIEVYKRNMNMFNRLLLQNALKISDEITSYFKNFFSKIEIIPMGSLRRGNSTVGDIDLLAVCEESLFLEVINYFINYPKKQKIENKGINKATIFLKNGIRVDLRLCTPSIKGSMQQYFTGNKNHNILLREIARKKGYSLSEFGAKNIKNSKVKKFSNELKLYNFFGFSYIPPELREGTDEFSLAEINKIPKLIELSDVKGDLHIHSDYNVETSHDIGSSCLEEIVKKAKEMNYLFVSITDHNPSKQNHTFSEICNILKKRKEFISKIEKKYKIRCFNSLEIDINPDGTFPVPIEAFKYLDYVTIAIHNSFNLEKNKQTKRIIRALLNDKVKILAHPTARKLGSRPEINVDWNEVFKIVKKYSKALEINASPFRLDLPDTMVKKARDKNLFLSIGTDAHSVFEMDNIKFGVIVARRGWCKKSDIINTKSITEVEKWLLIPS